MPSFDVVSEVDIHELRNAVDQANREIQNRYDFKGSDSRVDLGEETLTIRSADEFKVGQARDILELKLAKRNVDVAAVEFAAVEDPGSGKARQEGRIRQGIGKDLARDLVKEIKSSKLKVQAAIQGDRVRVTGKKRDDLQAVIALLKDKKFDQPLQFINFRD